MKPRKIVITDSGLGGLDVAARLYEMLKARGEVRPTEIIFANALPETNHGYNKMPNDAAKIDMFNRVLWGIKRHFDPEIIAIACNTLSAIVAKTAFRQQNIAPLVNIIELGVELVLLQKKRAEDAPIFVFATETTVRNQSYQKALIRAGISEHRIVAVECPGLASEIERDFRSRRTRAIVEQCVANARQRSVQNARKSYVILGCTHYGYVQSAFEEALTQSGFRDFEILNPNMAMVHWLERWAAKESPEPLKNGENVQIRVFARCRILPEEIESVSALLEPVSPDTVFALRNYVQKDDLF